MNKINSTNMCAQDNGKIKALQREIEGYLQEKKQLELRLENLQDKIHELDRKIDICREKIMSIS